ncbi:MAG: aldehyde dehydrogenase family protein [candidate division KSB1 bacterium]|nr:aldehyde dehydrogenase family protein [candidate division KSB1 bacterium]
MIRDTDLQSIQQVRTLLKRAREAQQIFKTFSQEQVDRVFAAMAEAGYRAAEPLARLAVEETGYGKVGDKILKNKFATRDVYEAYIGMHTVGVLREDKEKGILEIGEPVGVVAAIIPTTNPTSTALFKGLIAIKARNGIVVSPHPRAVNCTCEAVRIVAEAAERAGAPSGLIGCITTVHLAGTQELMRARETSVILATGGPGLVRAAYSAGKPAYGVGPGNVPVYIDRSADVAKAVADVIAGKSFDWGTLCSSEQALVVDEPVYDAVVAHLREKHAYFLNDKEVEQVGRVLVTPQGGINPELVGHSPQAIGRAAGIYIPDDVQVLVAPLQAIGKEVPLSREKLSPVLALYRARDWEDGCEKCIELLKIGGMGHTLAIHARDEHVIMQFGLHKPAFRILVNTPASIGAVGYTTGLDPSMTLGCGSLGGNITADNISPKHLLNIKRVAYETKPLSPMRETGETWRPSGVSARKSEPHFPYQKALSSDVSRKGSATTKSEPKPSPSMPHKHRAPAVTVSNSERKYGTSGLSGEDVDQIVARFLKERGLQ